MQRCTICRLEKPESEFYKRTRYPKGRGTEERCKECTRAATRAHHEANRERILAGRRAAYASNPEPFRQVMREHYKNNVETYAQRAKRWREANRDHKNSREQERRARVHLQTVERVDRVQVYLRRNGVCGICGRPVDRQTFQVDHIIPISKGGAHSYANTQPAHPKCNQGKKDR